MADEEVLLEEPGVRVTTTRAELGGATYPIAGVSSVRSGVRHPGRWVLIVAGAFAVGCMGLGTVAGGASIALVSTVHNPTPLALSVLLVVVGVILAAVGTAAWLVVYPLHYVAMGELTVFSSTDPERVARVRGAIEEAIARRG